MSEPKIANGQQSPSDYTPGADRSREICSYVSNQFERRNVYLVVRNYLNQEHRTTAEARADAFRKCAIINRQMAGTIGALPGSSIWAALEACAQRMDEIVDATLSPLTCVEGRDHG